MEINNISTFEFKHKTEIQIRFNDIDIAGHVNNAVYQYYFDYGKLHYLDTVFGKLIEWKKYGFVLLNINIDFVTPIYLHDKIEVETKIIQLKNKSIEILQIIREKNTKNNTGVKSVARSIMVAYNFIKKESFVIPETWREAVKNYENL